MFWLIRAAAVLAVSLLVGCGGGASSGEGDPATAVPANALFYAEFAIQPEGSLGDDAADAAGKLLATDDPGARIRALITESFEEETGEDLDWERDVEPWLGERAAFWATPSEAGGFGVLLLAVKDADAARDSIRAELERDGESAAERSHRGTEYFVDSDDFAAGVVGDFAAFGSEAELRRTIDASEGDSLAETDEYRDAVGVLAEERLAHFWADTAGLFEQAMREDPELGQLGSLVPVGDLPPLAGAFLANGERLELDLEVRSSKDLGFEASGTPLLEELPGDTWAAAGAADVGESVRASLDRFAGAIGGVALRGQIRRELGLDLDRDLLDWIGHTAVFVRGTSPGAMDGGLVIQPTDEDRAADAFGRIVGVIQQQRAVRARPVEIAGADQAFAIADGSSPRPIVLARGSGLVVATVGAPAAEAAFGDDDRFGETDTYSEAADLVGMEPSFVLSMPQMLELVDAAGAGNDPDYLEVRRYLELLSVIAAGVTASGNEATVRFAAGLR